MVPTPTREEMASYRETLRRRETEEAEALASRKARAWDLARRAAETLRSGYGATRVVVFGSLVSDDRFHLRSDVDLAAWGIAPEATFRAIGEVLGLGSDPEVNLADVNTCSPALLRGVEREGIDV